jgi:hypothetical protein
MFTAYNDPIFAPIPSTARPPSTHPSSQVYITANSAPSVEELAAANLTEADLSSLRLAHADMTADGRIDSRFIGIKATRNNTTKKKSIARGNTGT